MTERHQYYKLVGHTPVPCEIEEAGWRGDRHVAKTRIGEACVSTVFLPLDHSYSDDGPPIVFETLIFGGPHAEEMWRYATWEEAEEGHRAAVAILEAEEWLAEKKDETT